MKKKFELNYLKNQNYPHIHPFMEGDEDGPGGPMIIDKISRVPQNIEPILYTTQFFENPELNKKILKSYFSRQLARLKNLQNRKSK